MLTYHVYKHGKFRGVVTAETVNEADEKAWELCEGLCTMRLIRNPEEVETPKIGDPIPD